MRVDLHESVSRRAGRSEFALLFPQPGAWEVLVVGKYLSGLVTSIILFTGDDGDCDAAALLPAFLFAEREFLPRGPGNDPTPHVRGNHDAGVRRLRRVLSRGGSVYSQSDHSRAPALRLGVAKLPAAAVVEEDQRDSLSQLAGAGAGLLKVHSRWLPNQHRRGSRSQHAARHSHRARPRGVSHPPHGDPLRND